MMTDLASAILAALIASYGDRVADVEGDAFQHVREVYPDLDRSRFDVELEGLVASGYLTRTRAKRDGAGLIVAEGSLLPTPNGRNAVR